MNRNHFEFNDPILKERRRSLRKNQTDSEKLLWRKIRNKQLGARFWRQYSVGPYILDFYCPSQRVAIELDGGQHAKENVLIYDGERTSYLNEQRITVIRFWNNEVIKNIEGVLDEIFKLLNIPTQPPLT